MLPPHITATATLITLLLTSPGAWAVYKCKAPDGRTVYQERPCADGQGTTVDTRPAAGYGASTAASAAAPQASTAAAASQSQTRRKEGVFGPKWQRMTYLEQRGVPEVRSALYHLTQNCERKMRELEAQKARANNNLAGATWEQSISAQMQAEATMCDMRSRELQAEKDKLEKELRELQAENP